MDAALADEELSPAEARERYRAIGQERMDQPPGDGTDEENANETDGAMRDESAGD